MRLGLSLAMLPLAACSAEPQANPSTNAAAAPSAPQAASPPAQAPAAPVFAALAIEGEGLRLLDRDSGAARPIAFGTAREPVMRALAFRGAAETGSLEECSAGPLDYASWSDGLTLYFQEGKFVGWAVGRDGGNSGSGGPAIATVAGVGPGSTRAELDSAYAAKVFESTLGTEFAAGDLFGILDGTRPTSRITHMWAGASCNMR